MNGPGEPAIRLGFGAATDIGPVRSENQDRYLAAPPIFAIADGMGGHMCGSEAAQQTLECVAQCLNEQWVTPSAITDAVQEAEDKVNALAVSGARPGSTLSGVALSLSGGRPTWIVFNIGDSRTYFYARGSLELVTKDHSEVQELVDLGVIDTAEAQKAKKRNVITRAIGGGMSSRVTTDLWMFPVMAGERILVCSDGLTRECSDEQLREIMAAEMGAQDTANMLVQAALAAGTRDNVTAIVVDIFEIREAIASPTEQVQSLPEAGLSADLAREALLEVKS